MPLFSRRGFNIDSLAVGETDDPETSRVTIVADGDEHTVEQLEKLLFVYGVRALLYRDNACAYYFLYAVGTDKLFKSYQMSGSVGNFQSHCVCGNIHYLRAPMQRSCFMKHTISILVENHAGVLSRISGLFSRRGFNIFHRQYGLRSGCLYRDLSAIHEPFRDGCFS